MLRHTPPLLPLSLLVAFVAYACSPVELRVGRRCPEGVSQCESVVEAPDAAEGGAVEAAEGGAASQSDAGGDVQPSGHPKRNACVPGYYTGEYFIPTYKATPAGICGLVTLFGGATSGLWQFRLPAVATGSGVMPIETCLEFEAVPIGGRPHQPQRIRTEFEGSLDCATGKLQGQLRGAYSAQGWCDGGEQTWYSIKAFVGGTFDAERGSFEGSVDIYEKDSLISLPSSLDRNGGEGEWQASVIPGVQGDMPTSDCLEGVGFTDFEVSP